MDKNKILIILDGWGYSEIKENNAIALANKPTWDKLTKDYPHTLIHTSGLDVGLPDGQMGNSEVGHLNLGSGRVVKQDYTRISDDIESGFFFHNQVLVNALTTAVEDKKAVHIMGLLSDGGVHSHDSQIHAMLEMAKKQGCKNVYLHIFTDGRDTAPQNAKKYINTLEDKIKQLGIGKIVSIVGRYYAMDRDNRWDRVEKAYRLISQNKAENTANSAIEAIDNAYKDDINDEFIPATIIDGGIEVDEDDLFIMMNYRADRAREITQVMTQSFDKFANRNFIAKNYICLTQYKDSFNLPIAFAPEEIKNSLGEVVANLGMTQLRIAETEKYAHVTFFFSGGVEKPYTGEDRNLIQSPDVATYDLKPEMSAFELTDELVGAIESKQYNLIICNFANTDMVGHSGDLQATIKAVEAVDKCLAKVFKTVKKVNAEMLITADHGNAEKMLDSKTKQPHTAHTANLVPLIFVGRSAKFHEDSKGSLSDIAPTILELLAVDKPEEMTGKSLLEFDDK